MSALSMDSDHVHANAKKSDFADTNGDDEDFEEDSEAFMHIYILHVYLVNIMTLCLNPAYSMFSIQYPRIQYPKYVMKNNIT